MYAEIALIYQYAQLIPIIKEIIYFCYIQEDFLIQTNWAKAKDLLVEFCREVSKKNMGLANEIFNRLTVACSYTTNQNSNYILMGDELQDILPYMYQGMMLIGEIDISEDNNRFFSSKSGFLTYMSKETNRVYHSTVDPMWEAYELADRIYDSSSLNFCFLGCCLGYLPWQVYCQSDCSVDIYIFHLDDKYVNYAMQYGVLEWIPQKKLHFIIENDICKLIDRFVSLEGISGKSSQHILMDMQELLDDDLKKRTNYFCAQNNTRTLLGNQLTINSYRNAYNVNYLISEFRPGTISDEWIVVAAGPSLDERIEYLKNNVGKKTIICASTVLKKLLMNEIRPDAVAVLDPQARTWGHFEGLDDMSVPLLLNVTANWRFGEWYSGMKYLIPSLTDETTVRNYMLQGIECWNIGSTVSTMMLKIAIYLNAKRIEMVGMDLAYPAGKSHANNTMDERDVMTCGTPKVPSVSGGIVATSAEFILYIDEIENVIKNNQGVEFVNLSRYGAKLNGAKRENGDM